MFSFLKSFFGLNSKNYSQQYKAVRVVNPYLKKVRRGKMTPEDHLNISKKFKNSAMFGTLVADLLQSMSEFVSTSPTERHLDGEYYYITKTILFRTDAEIKRFTQFFKAADHLPYLAQLISDNGKIAPYLVDCVLSGKSPEEINQFLEPLYVTGKIKDPKILEEAINKQLGYDTRHPKDQ